MRSPAAARPPALKLRPLFQPGQDQGAQLRRRPVIRDALKLSPVVEQRVGPRVGEKLDFVENGVGEFAADGGGKRDRFGH